MLLVCVVVLAELGVQGAVERVLDSCDGIAIREAVEPLTDAARAGIVANTEALAGQGLRVLALAHWVHEGPASGPGSECSSPDFASILNVIEEGRRIFDNIQKFILHVLAANIGFVVALLTGLAFRDTSGVSVFLLTPVEILWMLMGTGAFCETGLGFEKAVPDILRRPPRDLRYGVFSPEFLLDVVVYGALMACCTIASFTLVVFGFGDGNLGAQCNDAYSAACDTVFRARAACFTTMSWIFLLFA